MNLVPDAAGYYALTLRAFSALAPCYDALVRPLRPMRREVVRFAAAPVGARVLDVATGTGAQALAFARQGYAVTGIDLVPAMLAVARRKAGELRVDFVEMDATRLDLPDSAFDVSTVSFALHDMPGEVRERALREMVRVTRPGGRIIVVDYALPANRAWRWFVLHLVGLWERGWYPEFVHADLAALLERVGTRVESARSALLGAARMTLARVPRD